MRGYQLTLLVVTLAAQGGVTVEALAALLAPLGGYRWCLGALWSAHTHWSGRERDRNFAPGVAPLASPPRRPWPNHLLECFEEICEADSKGSQERR